MFKLNNKDTSLTSFCYLYCYIWTYFAQFSSDFIVDLKQVNVCWAVFWKNSYINKNSVALEKKLL